MPAAGLDQLATLVDQSLLKPLADDRFFLLETLRAYARDRLDEAGESGDYALRHAQHYLALLEETEPLIVGARRGELLAWFTAEEDNLRAVLDRLGDAAPLESARAAEASGERHTLCQALRQLGVNAAERGDTDEAVRVFTRALEQAAEDDEHSRTMVVADIGITLMQAHRDEEGRDALRQSIEGFRALEDATGEATCLLNLGFLDLYAHDFDSACAAATSVLAKNRSIGDRWRGIYALQLLGLAELGLDRRSGAREALVEALDIVLGTGMTAHALFPTLLGGIALAGEPAEFRHGARLRGAAASLYAEGEYPPDPRMVELERFLEQPLIEALGDEVYAHEQTTGDAMSRDDAVSLARSLCGARDKTRADES